MRILVLKKKMNFILKWLHCSYFVLFKKDSRLDNKPID